MSATPSKKFQIQKLHNRKHSVQWNSHIDVSHKSRRASINPVFNVSPSNNAIDEEMTNFSDKEIDGPRKKPNTAERIQMIRRTLRRQSTTNAPIQPPKHSIMAGFAGFLNMTTATCNTGVPEERRMSIPVVIQDDENKTTDTPKARIPYSNLPPVELSKIYQNEDSDLTKSTPARSVCAGSIGKLRTRWSDSNVVVGKRRTYKISDTSEDSSNNPWKISSNIDKPSYNHSTSLTITGLKTATNPPSSSNEKNDHDTVNHAKRNTIRSDSLACIHPDKMEAMLRLGGINRARNNSDPYVTIRVTGKLTVEPKSILNDQSQ